MLTLPHRRMKCLMMKQNRALLFCLALLGAALGLNGTASAQGGAWPERPVRIVVPFAAGGGVDQVARMLAPVWQAGTGGTFIVDNRAGGNTNIGADAVAKAAPDGYTLLLCTASTMAANPHLFANLPYNAQKDFTPIGQVSTIPFFVVVPATSPIHTLADLVAAAKKDPGSLTFASAGGGTTGHLGFESFNRMAGIQGVHAPYKAYTAALPDLISGRVSAMMADLPVIGSALKAGRLRVLATTVKGRTPFMPDTPSIAELGYPDFDMSVWFGVFAPTGTPPPIIVKLNAQLQQFLRSDSGKKQLAALGHASTPTSPEALGELVKSESLRWGQLIRSANIKVD